MKSEIEMLRKILDERKRNDAIKTAEKVVLNDEGMGNPL